MINVDNCAMKLGECNCCAMSAFKKLSIYTRIEMYFLFDEAAERDIILSFDVILTQRMRVTLDWLPKNRHEMTSLT